jgi:hypothetical protein
MHVIHSHLPRAVIISLAALATIVIVIMLILAARLGDLQLGQNQASRPPRETVTRTAPQLTARSAAPPPSAWLTDPFAPLVPDPVAPPRMSAARGQ